MNKPLEMPLYCKWLIKETYFAEAAEALVRERGTILVKLRFFVKACDVYGSADSSNEKHTGDPGQKMTSV